MSKVLAWFLLVCEARIGKIINTFAQQPFRFPFALKLISQYLERLTRNLLHLKPEATSWLSTKFEQLILMWADACHWIGILAAHSKLKYYKQRLQIFHSRVQISFSSRPCSHRIAIACNYKLGCAHIGRMIGFRQSPANKIRVGLSWSPWILPVLQADKHGR